MPGINIAPAWSFLSTLSAAPLRPFHTWVRTTEERFRPAQVETHRPVILRAQSDVFASGGGDPRQRVGVYREAGAGHVPTIVVGGFVPDAAEQIFLLRRFLLRSGDVYYLKYPREGFSLDVVCAQLTDLVDELCANGTPPVLFGVSFGCGILVEWLRRARVQALDPLVAGVLLVSPVTCIADLVAPGAGRPCTLLGRALAPFLHGPDRAKETAVKQSRAIFTRMFDAGTKNKLALRLLMTPGEIERLRIAVLDAIHGVTAEGAQQRVTAMISMPPPTTYFSPTLLPLTAAPALVLFAEREDAVLDPDAPTLFAFGHGCRAYFANGRVQWIKAKAGGTPVQHASLIFHVFDFLPPLQDFYQRVRSRTLPLAA